MPAILAPICTFKDNPKAIDYICQFAQESKLKILFYRAINSTLSTHTLALGPTGIGAAPAPIIYTQSQLNGIKKNDIQLINHWKQAHSNFPSSEYVISEGSDHDVIKAIDSTKSIEFLFKTSSSSYSWIDKIVPTETSELTNIISCPIISLPKEIEFEKLSTIVYASDLIDEDLNGLKTVNQLAQTWNAQVYLIHVCTNAQDKKKNESKLTLLAHQLTTKIRPVTITLERENVMQPLHELALKLKANLIVTVKKNKQLVKRLFEPSITAKLETGSTIPVMILNSSK